ncbi:hypothetical protein Rsub_11664 [Raphidocelis subcapitata]|uniref:Protein SCAI n=1 Tax=Raphidocelis subcapitata TaxID=307507 RepID=A0A2V0PLE0_9CHLO|nr:hypothetical protein Rsub_11664 [Raphidocelis subcapitata]|eukprot:GBF98670.1 hypothetical protein Rsub_11664 [Raphidocelis subcapitata]
MAAPRRVRAEYAEAAISEFERLRARSHDALDKLRELPPFGDGGRWQRGFEKAFAATARLWRFQGEQREPLTAAGLERWEIGDIAAKIGQLYYSYYLRTGEARALRAAYSYHEAVRARAYFSTAGCDAALAVRQLRYTARFAAICLLCARRDEAWALLQEFQALATAYALAHAPPDAAEWQRVVADLAAFLTADAGLPQPRGAARVAGPPLRASLRLSRGAPEARVAAHRPVLRHAVLATSGARQARVGDLPLDALRMLQAIEWEDARDDPAAAEPSPTPLAAAVLERAERRKRNGGSGGGWPGGSDGASTSTSSGASTSTGDRQPLVLARTDSSSAASCSGASTCGGRGGERSSPFENPSRHLLSRPSALQLLSTLTTTIAALPRNAILLLHLCCDQLASIADPPGLGGSGGGGANSAPLSSASGASSSTGALHSACSEISADCGAATTASDSPRAESLWSDMSALSAGQLSESGGSNPPGGRERDPREATLAPEDLLPLTRRSLLVVVDGEGAQAFAKLEGHEVSRPLFCMMAPAVRPPELGSAAKTGGLLTHFLSLPLSAVCVVAGNTNPTGQQLAELQSTLNSVTAEWAAALLQALAPGGSGSGSPWAGPLRDALLRRLVLRFVLCRAIITLHGTVGPNAAHHPTCFPQLPGELDPGAPEIASGVARLVACLGRSYAFDFGRVSAP